MNNQFQDLTLALEEELYEQVDTNMKDVYKEQKSDLNDTLNQIAQVILTYTIIDNVLSLNMFDKRKLKSKFNSNINNIVKKQYKYEKLKMFDILNNSTKDKYYSDAYVLDLGINFKLNKLTKEQIEKIVNSKIDKKLWSERLWTNKKALEKDLKREISKLLNGETDINKIEKIVKNKYNQNAYNSKRLINNEVARCQSQVNDVFASEHGIKKQRFMATLDNKTSNICQNLDGTVWDINDPNKPIIPDKTHINCRSVLVNIVENWKPSVRKDNITKEYGKYSTYQDWKQTNNID